MYNKDSKTTAALWPLTKHQTSLWHDALLVANVSLDED